MACDHPEFETKVTITRPSEPVAGMEALSARLAIRCAKCRALFLPLAFSDDGAIDFRCLVRPRPPETAAP